MALSGSKKFVILLALFIGGLGLLVGFSYTSYRALSKFVRNGDTESETFSDHSGNLAVLEVSGVIMESKDIIKNIRELKERDNIKAVVLRINSPGGAVAPTQEIHDALLDLRKSKTLVCSLGDLAASGGYYIAVTCQKIVANPGTLTGSIGVIMQFMNLKELYTWAKVDSYVLKAGKFKDIGSSLRPMTDEEHQMLQELLDNTHKQFKTAVATGRSFKPGYIDIYGDGRVFTGEQAKDLGFVDSLGGEQAAVNMAAEMAGIKGKPKIIRETNKKDRFSRFFDSDSKYGGGGIENSVDRLANRLLPNLELQPGVAYLLPAHMFTAGMSAR